MQSTLDTPLGRITLTEQDGALTTLAFTPDVSVLPAEMPVLRAAQQQLTEYFAGARRTFELPLRLQGTAFQQRAWAVLRQISYGQIMTYGQQAAAMGSPRASRAAGAANGKNPLPILIPCHRVIAADGTLGGYSCGLERKAFLLRLEGALE